MIHVGQVLQGTCRRVAGSSVFRRDGYSSGVVVNGCSAVFAGQLVQELYEVYVDMNCTYM